MAEWVRLWFDTYSKPNIREQTAYYYSNYIEKQIVPGIGSIKLDKLAALQIQRFYNKLKTSGRIQRYDHIELKDKGLSNRFIRGVHSLLHAALDQAVRERLIQVNPSEGCKLPKIEKKEMKVLLPEQIGDYLWEAGKRGLLPAFYLELTSGLRRGRVTGPAVDGPGHRKPDHLRDQTGKPGQRPAEGEPAQDPQLHPHHPHPKAGGGFTGTGA